MAFLSSNAVGFWRQRGLGGADGWTHAQPFTLAQHAGARLTEPVQKSCPIALRERAAGRVAAQAGHYERDSCALSSGTTRPAALAFHRSAGLAAVVPLNEVRTERFELALNGAQVTLNASATELGVQVGCRDFFSGCAGLSSSSASSECFTGRWLAGCGHGVSGRSVAATTQTLWRTIVGKQLLLDIRRGEQVGAVELGRRGVPCCLVNWS
jgi:hypothetical protein